jgi:hypothetical protein
VKAIQVMDKAQTNARDPWVERLKWIGLPVIGGSREKVSICAASPLRAQEHGVTARVKQNRSEARSALH